MRITAAMRPVMIICLFLLLFQHPQLVTASTANFKSRLLFAPSLFCMFDQMIVLNTRWQACVPDTAVPL